MTFNKSPLNQGMLQDTLKRVEEEEAERFEVGAGRSKDRQIP